LRAAIGVTQEEVVRRSRVSAKFLSQIENGRSVPSVDVFARIVEFGLATPLAQFFSADSDDDRDLAAMRSLLARQNVATRRRALRIIRALIED
jgi:transcriptional regulator with XRE-family HTH domain